MKGRLTAALILTLIVTTQVYAQGLPTTDLWLVEVENALAGVPTRISDGDGYNNQPYFSPDGSVIYYTREMRGDDGPQTDIAAFDIATATTTMITNTAESEYSPTPIPGRKAVSAIRADLNQKQLLCSIDIDSGELEVLFPTIEPVGYHAWFSDDEVAMFILGDSFTLQTARLNHDDAQVVADNIGRSIRKHPHTGEVLFVDKNHEPWEITAFDPESGTTRSMVPLFPGNEDFTIDSAGDFWTGNSSKLYKRSAQEKRWDLVADFSAHGINNISRLAVHLESGKIALVSDKAK